MTTITDFNACAYLVHCTMYHQFENYEVVVSNILFTKTCTGMQ